MFAWRGLVNTSREGLAPHPVLLARGKRFAFVRFIKVEYVDRLVENLSTIWIGRSSPIGSYVSALKTGKTESFCTHNTNPAIVLDESYILENECKLSVMGKVKEFESISNLYFILAKEGFENLSLSYLGGKVYWVRAKEVNGWTPVFREEKKEYYSSDEESVEGFTPVLTVSEDRLKKLPHEGLENRESNNKEVSSQKAINFQKEQHRYRGSILNLMDELVRVGQAMGYNMDGCIENIGVIIGEQGENDETKMEYVDLFTLKAVWGNFAFDHAISPSVGNFGGIICVWEPSIFVKENIIVYDSFLLIMGRWVPTDTRILIISVYAPQDLSEKRMLWEYLCHVKDNWDGESLVDIPLGGYSFTWAHKSATKMSKLDRFLISEGLLATFPHLSAICLDRHLSDHRSILLKEMYSDFGAIPFCIFHSWFQRDDFDKMVEGTWKNLDVTDNNRLIRLKKKLQLLKQEIHSWIKKEKSRSSMDKAHT
ncbi:RNA-directed DNA polymerase, eukaryota [Tanacetum coccineum]